jgi:hypothetical protein
MVSGFINVTALNMTCLGSDQVVQALSFIRVGLPTTWCQIALATFERLQNGHQLPQADP